VIRDGGIRVKNSRVYGLRVKGTMNQGFKGLGLGF
jgi:hypothetical protein